MINKNEVIEKAYECGFADIGFTSAETFDSQKEVLAYPRSMENYFGRCYLDDDRVTKDGLSKRVKAFREFLRENDVNSKVPFNLSHRLAAARAGMGTFGKNCLFYSNKTARKGSWVLPIAVVVDKEYIPELFKAFQAGEDERVSGMIAWALGRIGGQKAKTALNDFLPKTKGPAREETLSALDKI